MYVKQIPALLLSFFIIILFWMIPRPLSAQSQTSIQFTEGLAISNSHNYSRQAVYDDLLEWQLIHDQFETPIEGKIVDITEEGDTLKWQKVEVNDKGRFAGRELRSGYLYLTFQSETEMVMLLNAAGHNMAYVNGIPRAGDIYSYGYVHLPVKVKEGKNEILLRSARWGGIQASLSEPEKVMGILEGDLTLPHILAGEKEPLLGAVRIINSTDEFLEDAEIKSDLNGREMVVRVPAVPPMTIRKIPFHFDPSGAEADQEEVEINLELTEKGTMIDSQSITVKQVDPNEHHNRTFKSKMDGSVQYYAVAPQQSDMTENSALFLSVHGAEVEAINQARAYNLKEWGVLVAPTNRRPRGFNWEDYGRMDALEVLEIAKEKYQPDPDRIYLTGHSMGGHGTWYLGATYPDLWAAIAPAAGYPSLRMYGSHDGRAPGEGELTSVEEMLLRSGNPADVMSLIPNYKAYGVYILHGDADRVVPVEFARTMREELGKFHPDFAYYEYPGGSHWYGDESVDWPPLFEFFRNHTKKSLDEASEIQFKTANPGISNSFRWVSIDQQVEPLEFSSVHLMRDSDADSIHGSTENIERLTLDLRSFDTGRNLTVQLDESSPIEISVPEERSVSVIRDGTQWQKAGTLSMNEKGPHRYGGFKEAFKDHMLFVYGTSGNREEDQVIYNKARYDAETWYYRGNGSVDMIPDREFDAELYKDRGVILYGNSDTNSAWELLLEESPIQVARDQVQVGSQIIKGDELGAFFTYPRKDSDFASIAVITGTGVKGMKSTAANQYFAGGSGFPDFFIFHSSMLKSRENSVLGAGFFDNHWKLVSENAVFNIIAD